MSRKEPISKPASYITSTVHLHDSILKPCPMLGNSTRISTKYHPSGPPHPCSQAEIAFRNVQSRGTNGCGSTWLEPQYDPNMCFLMMFTYPKGIIYIIQHRKHKHTSTQTFTFHATNMQTNTPVVGHRMDPPSKHPPLTFRLWHPGGVVGDDAGIQDAVEHFLT